MTQYSNLQVNKLKSGITKGTEVTFSFSSNVICDSNDGTNFPHKLLLIDEKVSKLRKACADNADVSNGTVRRIFLVLNPL